jgi:hypothetical protein
MMLLAVKSSVYRTRWSTIFGRLMGWWTGVVDQHGAASGLPRLGDVPLSSISVLTRVYGREMSCPARTKAECGHAASSITIC